MSSKALQLRLGRKTTVLQRFRGETSLASVDLNRELRQSQLPVNGQSRIPRKSQEKLISAIVTQDKNLAQILHHLEEVLESLKSGPPDIQAVSEALQRAVLSAVKQSTFDRELRSLALVDELTSLYNRRAFFALAAQQMRVMRRSGQGLLLFFADVDCLKEINDRYGHREGDRALIRAGSSLVRTFRKSDIVARLGGDEFAVLALEASGQGQNAILRRLEDHIRASGAEETRYALSISVGMVRFDPKNPASLEDLIMQADQSMYEVKKSRRRGETSVP